jgi:hypothetical protein
MHEMVTDEFSFITLDQLEIVATLGMGGFGRVELVSEFSQLTSHNTMAHNHPHL